MERRLAAIVSIDIVGYSRLLGADEADTLARMKAHRAELWSPAIEQHGGRVVGTAGDSLLIEFSSAVSAVESAIEVQRGMAEREAGEPEDRKMLLRTGINVGEVVVEGDDIFGDGVNVAARLQALAEPGGILVSAKVHDEVNGKIAAEFADEGEHKVKNIIRPVRAWRWLVGDAPRDNARSAGAATEPPPLPDKPSIAVLPFDNMSGDPEQEYFSDGIADEIITGLSRFRDLFVIARNSSFTYKGTAVNIKQVGRELGVRYVLEGGVRKAGNRVRVLAQLVEAATGNHLWAEKYDGDLADIFELQDTITMAVVGIVQPTIFEAEMGRARRNSSESLDAYDLVLRGWSRWFELAPDSTVEAHGLAMKAIDADDSFAGAYSLLAMTHMLEVVELWSDDAAASVGEARKAAQRAVELDDADAAAHAVLAFSLVFDRRHDLALAAAERAIDTNPNLPVAHWARAVVCQFTGKPKDGEKKVGQAIRLSPRDPLTFLFLNTLAACQNVDGAHEAAAETASKLVALRPDYLRGQQHLAIACAELGETERARAAYNAIIRLKPDLNRAWFEQAGPYKDPADLERLLDSLRKAGWSG